VNVYDYLKDLTAAVMARYMVTEDRARDLVLASCPTYGMSYCDALDEVVASLEYSQEHRRPAAPPQPTGIEAAVCADIAARQKVGIAKYGRTLAESEDDMLQHAYEEALDLAAYLKAEILRRDKNKLANSLNPPTLET